MMMRGEMRLIIATLTRRGGDYASPLLPPDLLHLPGPAPHPEVPPLQGRVRASGRCICTWSNVELSRTFVMLIKQSYSTCSGPLDLCIDADCFRIQTGDGPRTIHW